MDSFIDGLSDADTLRALCLVHPKSLEEALARALEFDAAKQTSKGYAFIRNVDIQEQDGEFQMEETIRRVLNEEFKRRIRCWNCGEFEHVRRQSGKRELPRSSNHQEN